MSHVEAIRIKNFRNHSSARLDFTTGINVIWGENGTGKTAILEAIYTLSMGRSFRTRNHKETLKEDQEVLSLKGLFLNGEGETEVQMRQIKEGKRKFIVNKSELKKTKELIGENPIVLLSPEEETITKGSPGDLRSYFDKTFSTVSIQYLNNLIEYQKIIKQRNTAIQEHLKRRADKKDIEAWNEPAVISGKKLWKEKQKLIDVFSKNLSRFVEEYRDKTIDVFVRFEKEGSPDNFEERLKKSLNSDLRKGWTTSGPHRDSYHVFFNGKPIKKYGSQGEHKLALVLVKMAEIKTITNQTGKTPILLLDDMFAKLDFQRADDVLHLLSGGLQTIITTTDIVDIERHGVDLSSSKNSSFFLDRKCKA